MAVLPLVLLMLLGAEAPSNDAPATNDAASEEPTRPSIAPRTSASAARSPLPAKVLRYAERLVTRLDRDGDGKLQRSEWSAVRAWAEADTDADGTITADDLARRIMAYSATRKIRGSLVPPAAPEPERPEDDPPSESSPAKSSADEGPPSTSAQAGGAAAPHPATRFFVPPKRLPAGLPNWFVARDLDGDGQLTLSEFAPKATRADEQEFAGYDLNADGVLTPKEYLRAVKPVKAGTKR